MVKTLIKVQIPDGYELACDEMRIPQEGEYFLNMFGKPVKALFDIKTNKRVILKKIWQPEVGKYYKFWNNESDTPVVVLTLFTMSKGVYVTTGGLHWDNCEPINPEELGK